MASEWLGAEADMGCGRSSGQALDSWRRIIAEVTKRPCFTSVRNHKLTREKASFRREIAGVLFEEVVQDRIRPTFGGKYWGQASSAEFEIHFLIEG